MATLKQKKVVEKIIENQGMAVSVAMEQVGYKKVTAHNPKNLTDSKGWNELMEQYLPDKLLASKHKELLTVPKKVRTFIKGDLTSEYEELDSNAVKSGLDMAYKLKGSYSAEKKEHSGVIGIEQITGTVIRKDDTGLQDKNRPAITSGTILE